MKSYRYTETDLALIESNKKVPRQPIIKEMSEKELQSAVIELAVLNHWRHYHPFDSRKSVEGFPDLTLVQPPRLIFAELKSAEGVVTDAQKIWIEKLGAVPGIEAVIWRPADWLSGEIGRLLSEVR